MPTPIRPAAGARIVSAAVPRFRATVCLATALTLGASAARAGGDPPGRAATGDDVPRVASRATNAVTERTAPDEPVSRARRAIAACRAKYADVRDYTCTFVKRERVGGTLLAPHVMQMKARTLPSSIYFKFQKPNKGREAIYVAGRHGGKLLAHDVGIGRLLAGTMNLDPRGTLAMDENRHPVTEAGIGPLIESVAHHWALELTPEESVVAFHPDMTIGPHRCTLIESVHPARQDRFLFHKVRLYVDHEHGLPIRFEAYDWPKQPGAAPELVEEYTYLDLKLNVGLTERDFDPANKGYSFGRF